MQIFNLWFIISSPIRNFKKNYKQKPALKNWDKKSIIILFLSNEPRNVFFDLKKSGAEADMIVQMNKENARF